MAERERPTTSTRDRREFRSLLHDWFVTRLGQDAHPQVSEISGPTATGMSSDTLLFDLTWHEDGEPREQACAARLRPDASVPPVFPVYDLERQYKVMQLVGERTNVPVPRTLWFEADDRALGSPFFIMERVDGIVPPDVMPYVFGSWLMDAPRESQARLEEASIGVLAGIHGMPTTPADVAFLEFDQPGSTALQRHVADQCAYYEWSTDGVRVPVLERALDWLQAYLPGDEGPPVVSWGDSRIGNIIYRDFEPVAVLDWEMAGIAPREVDLAWMIFMHRWFQDIVESAGMPGMPHFLERDRVAVTYERLTGHTPRSLAFYEVYAAVRHGIVMSRVARRSIHFGEATMPEDPDDLVMHRASLDRMISTPPGH